MSVRRDNPAPTAGDRPGDQSTLAFDQEDRLIAAARRLLHVDEADADAKASHETDNPEPIPESIGRFGIRRKIGEGGMGVVYEAEQQDPRRAVALKVVRGGVYVDERRIKLFQREIQTLARLRHACIAAIYEAGRTEEGRHFFAMELVRGVPLVAYVRRKRLSMRERLRLFRKICEAINYAHQRGVVHRDLKPSNILVDAEGNPKILDFGLAKITEADIAVTTVVTEIGVIQGTLPYMSPEQARGNADEIDLRSDVYSLGVILFELMTERLPYEVHRAMLHEAVRVICEEAPRRPSTISRVLRGDVETIALKALEKEPSRRYQSAHALAEDIDRYLTDQPILARRPSAVYQFRKLVARHKVGFTFATGVVVLIVGFGSWMRSAAVENDRQVAERDRRIAAAQRRAERERTIAVTEKRVRREVTENAMDFLLGVIENLTVRARNERVTARDVLDTTAEGLEIGLLDREEAIEALVRLRIGDRYLKMGLVDAAAVHLKRALAIRRKNLPSDHKDVARAAFVWGRLLTAKGEHHKAELAFREAVRSQIRTLGPGDSHTLRSFGWLADRLRSQRKFAEEEAVLRRLLEAKRPVPDVPGRFDTTAGVLEQLAHALADQGKMKEARPFAVEAITLAWRAAEASDATAWILEQYANLLLTCEPADLRDPEAALPVALEAVEKSGGKDASVLNVLASAYRMTGDIDRAVEIMRKAVSVLRLDAVLYKVELETTLAGYLIEKGTYAEAESLLLAGYERLGNAPQVGHGQVSAVLEHLVKLYEARAEAEPGRGFAEKSIEWRAKIGRQTSR